MFHSMFSKKIRANYDRKQNAVQKQVALLAPRAILMTSWDYKILRDKNVAWTFLSRCSPISSSAQISRASAKKQIVSEYFTKSKKLKFAHSASFASCCEGWEG